VHSVTPDVAVFSKALGNGYPIAAVIGRADVMQSAQSTFISSTYWTDRIGPAAALAVIAKFRACHVAAHLGRLGEIIQAGWRDLAKRHGLSLHIGGLKPMSHFTFEMENAASLKAYFIQLMLERGYLASTLFYATYAHSPAHVEEYLRAADGAFLEVARSVERGDTQKRLKGKPAAAGFRRLT
jgi:glutamate-1-semialdehyde aminotransferase